QHRRGRVRARVRRGRARRRPGSSGGRLRRARRAPARVDARGRRRRRRDRGRDRPAGLATDAGARLRCGVRRQPRVARRGLRGALVSSHLEQELREQPEALARLIEKQRGYAEQVRDLFRRDDVQYILIASRGSSSNAARYAQYLLGRAHRVPVAFATPSLFTLYGQPPRLDGALVIGISQSGKSPDVVEVVTEARRQGRPTVALTNDPSSPLGLAAD